LRIELKANVQGQIYLPKILRDEWGSEFFLIPNANGGCIFPKSVKAKEALKSLDVVRKELEHRAELEQATEGVLS
jgi:hypothetical protein